MSLDFPGGSVGKNLPADAGETGLIIGSGRSSRERTGSSLLYFAWEIPWTEEIGRESMESQKEMVTQSCLTV